MNTERIATLFARFEGIVHHEQGVEYWLARELQEMLDYGEWRNFVLAIDKARQACATAGQATTDHFRDITRVISLGSGAERAISDVAMTRYGCYLLAQNGDPRKEAIAFAQTYFAVQTRRQEVLVARIGEHERVRARHRLMRSEKDLSTVIFERLGDAGSFGRIRSAGDRALFGGLTTQQMKDRLGVPEGRPLADFLPTVTIKAKDFSNELTIHNTKERDLRTEGAITEEHVANSTEVRKVMEVRGILPEQLPAAEDVKKVERRLTKETRNLPSATSLPAGSEDAGAEVE